MFEAVSLFGSVVVSPYEALLPEMAATSDERVGLEASKVYLGVAGTAIGLIVSTVPALAPLLVVLLRLLGDTRGHTIGVRLVGPLAGLILLAAYLLFRSYDLPDAVSDRVQPEAAV